MAIDTKQGFGSLIVNAAGVQQGLMGRDTRLFTGFLLPFLISHPHLSGVLDQTLTESPGTGWPVLHRILVSVSSFKIWLN